MKKVLEQLDKMKQDWAHEKMRLEGEREYLQGAADRLNREMDRAKKEQDMKEGGVLSVRGLAGQGAVGRNSMISLGT
jgi:hypothetical protein